MGNSHDAFRLIETASAARRQGFSIPHLNSFGSRLLREPHRNGHSMRDTNVCAPKLKGCSYLLSALSKTRAAGLRVLFFAIHLNSRAAILSWTIIAHPEKKSTPKVFKVCPHNHFDRRIVRAAGMGTCQGAATSQIILF